MQVITDLKQPAIIPHILTGLQNHDSAPLKAALCGEFEPKYSFVLGAIKV